MGKWGTYSVTPEPKQAQLFNPRDHMKTLTSYICWSPIDLFYF